MGIIIIISISNTRNRIAIRKNCEEKGDRDDLFGSNPHSKGEIFSRSIILFFLTTIHNVINKIEIVINIIIVNVLIHITFSYKVLLIGSQL